MTRAADPPGAVRLVVATYNIHRCVGTDGCLDESRVERVLRELDADVVALQEVETVAEGGLDLLARFAHDTGMTAIAGSTMSRAEADYGNALLSRLPVRGYERHDISVPRHEPRGVIDAILEVAGRPLRVCATHFGLMPWERRDQSRLILDILQSASHEPTLLMGDVNEWFLWGRPLRWLHRYFEETPACATFPSRWPLLALDRIWIKPRSALVSVCAHRSPWARLASDHLPLRAELLLPGK